MDFLPSAQDYQKRNVGTYNFLALYKRLTVNPSGYLQNLEFRVCSRFEFQVAYLNKDTPSWYVSRVVKYNKKSFQHLTTFFMSS